MPNDPYLDSLNNEIAELKSRALSVKSINIILSLVEQEKAENQNRMVALAKSSDEATVNSLSQYAINLAEVDAELRRHAG